MYWTTIYFFYVGLQKDCPELLDEIISIKTTNERTKILKVINLSNILLAGYLSPYDVISKGVEIAYREAVEHYFEIVNRDIDTPLAEFTEMQLLAIFRYMLSDGYSYEFFHPAIEDALIRISDDKNLSIEHQALNMFLLNTTYLEVGGTDVFNAMIENLGKNLPLTIQLAITHEADSLKLKSTSVRKVYKNINKNVKDNKSLRGKIKSVYEKPINKLSIK